MAQPQKPGRRIQMTETVKIKVTDAAHASTISEWAGLERAAEVLKSAKMDTLPGFALAAALVAKEAADARSQTMVANLKAASKVVEITMTRNISLSFERGVPILHVELMDLQKALALLESPRFDDLDKPVKLNLQAAYRDAFGAVTGAGTP
jgi:hypothetical protein